MKKTAQDVLKQITMINNINYNNNYNNTNIVSKENNEEEEIALLPSGITSFSAPQEPLEVAFMPPGTLPARWKGVKFDLFENPRKKLKITIVRPDNTKFTCVAALNSPRSYVFRGRDEDKGSADFWLAVESVYDKNKDTEDFRISKVSKPRKGQTLDNMAVALYTQDGVNVLDFIYDNEIYHYKLTGIVSEKFREANGVATAYIGKSSDRAWANKEELGI
jgi:hypothetical protein